MGMQALGRGSQATQRRFGASGYKIGNFTPASDALTPLILDVIKYDDSNFFADRSNPTKLVVAKAGKYIVGGTIAWSPSLSDVRILYVHVNGESVGCFQIVFPHDTGNETTLISSSIISLSVGDYVELVVHQSGGVIATVMQRDSWGEFWIEKADENTVDKGCLIERTTDQTIPSLTQTKVSFDTARYNSGGFDLSTATKVVIPRNGRYLIGFALDWADNDASIRYATLKLNNLIPLIQEQQSVWPGYGRGFTPWGARVVQLQKNDYLELFVLQYVGGGTLDLKARSHGGLILFVQEMGR